MLTLQVRLLKSFFDKSLGLLGDKNAHAVYLNTRFGIHTFFMQFPIDVIVLDNENSVVKLRERLQPNHIFLWPVRFDRVLELPAGEIQKNNIKTGDKITLKIIS